MDLVYNPLLLSFFPFLVAFVTTIVAVPKVRKIGQKHGFKDNPSPRKKDSDPLVRIGGLAIFLGFLIFLNFVIAEVTKSYTTTQTCIRETYSGFL